ncbi:hypothetical protein CERSUDRAFT_93418 [Gelatoporia subvermispora B]|uniref:J domain-containing protein n=1 Tax=Ceriporiopsis subvermispora (strain B) TaxID=914234 RepID=M2PRY4_CERS8|nr:hypothetical protein CERSUDRAFT_93418 [Gelatoporia subvermispora B]
MSEYECHRLGARGHLRLNVRVQRPTRNFITFSNVWFCISACLQHALIATNDGPNSTYISLFKFVSIPNTFASYTTPDFSPASFCISARDKGQINDLTSLWSVTALSNCASADYDLVRIHHPDSPLCKHLSPNERHTRFQRIASAYSALRSGTRGASGPYVDPFREELERRRRAQMRRGAEMARDGHADGSRMAGEGEAERETGGDQRWKDRIMIMIGFISLAAGLYPAVIWQNMGIADARHRAAASNLAQARRDAREHGQEQRIQIKKRVEENRRLAREAQERERKPIEQPNGRREE